MLAADLLTAALASDSSRALVSSAASIAPIGKVILTLTDSSDHPITGNLGVGQTFWVDVSLQDDCAARSAMPASSGSTWI